MDLSYAEDEGEAELQAAEQQCVVRRCYTCGSTKQLRPGCPCVDSARLRLNTLPEPEVWHSTGKCRYPVGAGRPTGEELGSVTPLGGKVEQGLAPKSSIPIGIERG